MRKTTALIAAIAILGSLTACAGGAGSSLAGCDRALSPGTASSIVTAPGEFGAAPKVDFPTPLYTSTSQVSTIIAGAGAPITAGQPVILDVTIINGANGSQLQKTSYNAAGGSLITAGTSAFPAVSLGLECAQAGSRIAIVASAKDSHNGVADAANGIGKDDSFVYVVDVKDAFLARANGADQIPVNGMPSVVLTADGTPGISVPSRSAPKTAEVNLLKTGSGPRVKNGEFVVVKYTAIGWGTKTVFDSTWTDHQASVLQVGSATVSTGLSAALIGQRIGSQVLAVLPPKDSAVADGSGKAPTDDAAIYVVDILGIAG